MEKVNDILDVISEGIYYVDTNRKITMWNRAAEKISGFTKEDVIGKNCGDNILRHVDDKGTDLCVSCCPLQKTIEDGKVREEAIYLHHKDGHRVEVTTRVCPLYGDDGAIIGAVELFNPRGASEPLNSIEEMKRELYTDGLTGTGNRKFADMVLNRKICDRDNFDLSCAVFFLDIDDFKQINDKFGHTVGDRVLIMTAKSVSAALRSLDCLCRWGGEEFIVVMPNVTEDVMAEAGEKMRIMVEKSWLSDSGNRVRVTASIGCTMVKSGDTVEDIVKRADQGMYGSKRQGKNKVTVI